MLAAQCLLLDTKMNIGRNQCVAKFSVLYKAWAKANRDPYFLSQKRGYIIYSLLRCNPYILSTSPTKKLDINVLLTRVHNEVK